MLISLSIISECIVYHFYQNEDYRLRFAVSEWRKIEYELTRERGLWGPENPSQLDKWTLDTVEGVTRRLYYIIIPLVV